MELRIKGKVWSSMLLVSILFGVVTLQGQELIDLGHLGSNGSYGYAINDSGDVVGESGTNKGIKYAFLYSDSGITNLGSLGVSALGSNKSTAWAINDSGQIVGQSQDSDGSYYAFVYSNGSMTKIASPSTWSTAYGINNSGQVVGQTLSGSKWYAYVYSGGVTTMLNTYLQGDYNYATAINNYGQVVGHAGSSTNSLGKAFVYTAGSVTYINTFGGNASVARDINDSGLVVGFAQNAAGNSNAFAYSGSILTNLGTLGGNTSDALGVNNVGQVVGYSTTSDGTTVAFLYSTEKGMQNLNDIFVSLLVSGTDSQLGFTSLTKAYSINDSGEIAGYGKYWDGTYTQTRAFLLQTTPEPSIWLMLATGCFILFGVYRSRSKHIRLTRPRSLIPVAK